VTLEYVAMVMMSNSVQNLSISISLGEVARAAILSVIWISYMSTSRRVKETFVR
jgi:hypothetical protein